MSWDWNSGDWHFVPKQYAMYMMQELAYSANEREKLMGRGDTNTAGSPWSATAWSFNDIAVEPFMIWRNVNHGLYNANNLDPTDIDFGRESFPDSDYFGMTLLGPFTPVSVMSNNRVTHTLHEFISDFHIALSIISGTNIDSSNTSNGSMVLGYEVGFNPFGPPIKRPFTASTGHLPVKATGAQHSDDATIPIGAKLLNPYKAVCTVKGSVNNSVRTKEDNYPNIDDKYTWFIPFSGYVDSRPIDSTYGYYGKTSSWGSFPTLEEVYGLDPSITLNVTLSQTNIYYYLRYILEQYKYITYLPAATPLKYSAPATQENCFSVEKKEEVNIYGSSTPIGDFIETDWDTMRVGSYAHDHYIWIDEDSVISGPGFKISTFGYTDGRPFSMFSATNHPRFEPEFGSSFRVVGPSEEATFSSTRLNVQNDMEIDPAYVWGVEVEKRWGDDRLFDDDGNLLTVSGGFPLYDTVLFDADVTIGSVSKTVRGGNINNFLNDVYDIDLTGSSFPAAGEYIGFEVAGFNLPDFPFAYNPAIPIQFMVPFGDQESVNYLGTAWAAPRDMVSNQLKHIYRNPRITTDISSVLTYG